MEVSTCFLSEIEVDEAYDLAKNGQQRLRAISETQETFFCFLAPCESHVAFVKVKVSPVTEENSRYPSYDVFARYTPCCHIAQSDPVDEHIKTVIQLIYDTYIRAIPRTFDDYCREREPPPASGLSCEEKKRLFLEWSRGGCNQDGHRRNEVNELAASADGNDEWAPASALQCHPQISRSLPPIPKRRRPDENDAETSAADDSHPSEIPKRQKCQRQSAEKIADNLINKIQSGMKEIKNGEWNPVDFSDIQKIASDSLQQGTDDAGINKLLMELETAFDKSIKSIRNESKVKTWIHWYYLSCVRFIRHIRRQDKRDRLANGVYIINSIVNSLVPTDGIDALAVILACAEKGYSLSKASEASERDQTEIIRIVVERIQGKLIKPPENCIVPNTIAWISVVTKCSTSYQKACYDLCSPNLAVLRIEPSLALTQEGISHEWLPYSFVVERWNKFALMKSRLSQALKQHKPQEWNQSSFPEQFSLMVNEWCNPQLRSADAWNAAASTTERLSKRRRIEKTTSKITTAGCEEGMALNGNEATGSSQGLHVLVSAAELHSQDSCTQTIRDNTHPPATEYLPNSILHRSFMDPSFMDDLHHWNLAGDDFVATGHDHHFIQNATSIQELIDSAQRFTLDHIPRGTANVDYILSYGARLDVNQHRPIARARIFELQWPSVLDRKMDEAIKSLHPNIQIVAGQLSYDWETLLVHLEFGRVRAPNRALCSIFIPVRMVESDENRRVQFESDEIGTLMAIKTWPPLVILPRSFCIRKVKCSFFFIWVRIYPKGTIGIE